MTAAAPKGNRHQASRWQRLWAQLPGRRRRQLLLATALMLVSGALEMLSLAAVVPLLVGLMQWGQGGRAWVLWLFCLAVSAAALVRIANLQVTLQLAGAIGADLGEAAFRRTLGRPYRAHGRLESSRVVAILAPQQRQLISQVLQQALQLASASLLTMAIALVLLVMAWRLVLPLLAVVLTLYVLLQRLLRRPLRRRGEEAVLLQRRLIRMIQEHLAAIRTLLLRGGSLQVAAEYGALDRRMRRLEAANGVLNGLPRYLFEPLGMVAIALTGLLLLERGQTPLQVLPSLGLLAFAAQRLLPLSQQVWTAWASLTAGEALLDALLELLEWPEPLEAPMAAPLQTWRRVSLESVRFAYTAGSAAVLEEFSLQLQRGEWLGLSGPSGAGKSTVVDLLLGLQQPERGALLLDGQPLQAGSQALRRWQAGLAHVGPVLPLVAGDVAANIRIGAAPAALQDEVLAELAALTGLSELLERDPGEAGRNLSGGQRQRIGLARALARPLSLLVLDEATASLDLEAEATILGELRRRQPALAVLLVSHRAASLELCDRVLRLPQRDG